MKRSFLIILFILLALSSVSQKIQKVSATYTYYAPETISVEEAKRTALDRAKIQAIADAFGTIVSQSISTVISNKNGQSDTQFFSLGGSDVKGEWIETIGEPVYNVDFEDHFLVVTCTVKGKIREIDSPKIDIVANTLRNGTDLKFASTEFKDGDDMYLYFKSPENGTLSVYLIDESNLSVYMLLPYTDDKEGAFKIEANTEYILFSKKCAPELKRAAVVEYNLTCNGEKEFNDIVVVFSPTNQYKPNLKSKREALQPPSLDYNSFLEWKYKIQKHSENIIKTISISISK